MKKNISLESIYFCNLFEKLTRTKVKDCFVNSDVTFVVNEGDAPRAIGKKGIHAQRIRNVLKKKVRIVEYSENPVNFVKNLISPLKTKEIYEDNGNIEIRGDIQTKALLIGRNRKNLEQLNNIVRKYFDVEIRIK